MRGGCRVRSAAPTGGSSTSTCTASARSKRGFRRAERETCASRPRCAAPSPSIPTDFAEHARIMMDLLTLAFQTDSTRVATVLLGIEQSPRSYGAEIGISEAHHGLTHHSGDREKIEKVTKINCYHIQQFTYLLDKLKSGEGRRRHAAGPLDDRLRQRSFRRQPPRSRTIFRSILAGRGNGTLKPGRMVRYPDETPITNLYVAMLDRMGVPVGDARGQHRALGYLSEL